MSEENNRQRFERQRRNLILTSMLLSLYAIFGLELNEINILGNKFYISNPYYLETIIWFVNLYFLLRFYFYYKVVNNSEFYGFFSSTQEKVIKWLSIKKFTLPHRWDVYRSKFLGKTKYTITDFATYSSFPWHRDVEVKATIHWQEGGSPRDESVSIRMRAGFFILLLSKILGYLKLFFQTPHITEYHFPIWIVFIALGLKLDLIQQILA